MTATRHVPTVGALMAAWILLQGSLTIGNTVAGGLVAVAVVVLFPLEPVSRRHRVHPLALVSLVCHFTWLVLRSNAQLVVAILRPNERRLRAAIIRVELTPTSPLVTTLVGNGLSLTPGNLTLSGSEDGVIHVHILGLDTVDDARTDALDLHRRVIAALEPRPQERP
ncbi:MAG: Na+/H+ antiporter subunit E [Ilumatobacteraceae bacterium]